MTPKTESGRTDHERAWEHPSDYVSPGDHTWEPVGCPACARIAAIEQEAASKAVAEVLDERTMARALHDAMCETSHHDGDGTLGPCWPRYPLVVRSMLRRRALIDSERKP